MLNIGKLKKRAVSIALTITMAVTLTPYYTVGSNADEGGGNADKTPPVFQTARNYGGAATDAFHDVAYTKDGGFVVMGYSFGESSDPEWTHSGNANQNDAVLLKFDKDYKLQWSKAYGGGGIVVFNSIDVLNDGRIAAIGRASFNSSDSSIKNVSWYILVIDPDDPDSYKDYRIGGTAGDQGYGIAATGDGGFVAAGWTASKTGFMTGSSDRTDYSEPVQLWEAQDGTDESIPNRIAASGSDSVVVKFDRDGNVQFTALHNYSVSEKANNVSSPSERLEALAVDSSDNIYITGYDAIAKNAQNAVIAKLSGTDGSLLWHRSAGRKDQTIVPEDAAEYIKAVYDGVAVLKDGSVAVTGTSTGDATTDEGWRITGVKDTLVVHYSADGRLINSENFGAIDDNDSRPEGITSTPDGGYIICANQSGVMQEPELISRGYDWGNYGGEDAVLVKYDSNDNLVWAKNYGTGLGDWINAVAVKDNGEIIAVGESNGKNGNPAWGNNGGIDGVIMCTGKLADYTESAASSPDGNVTWADGTYEATGDGYGGADSVGAAVTVKDSKISSVAPVNYRDTATEAGRYYNAAAAGIPDRIVAAQSVDVDAVSGATYSSSGIKEAVAKALGQSAAAYVDNLISAAAASGDKAAVQEAADAYAELGSYSVSCLTRFADLRSAADEYGITLESRAGGQALPETQPEIASGLRHNDTYYRLQYKYYKNINAEVFEDAGITGEGVKIAVIDSGVNANNTDLDYSRILTGYNYDDDVEMSADNLIDNNGHGTAVTGILAAIADNNTGVAGLFSKLQIVPLKVTPLAPSKDADGESSKQVAQAIRDAVDKYGVDVITTSLDVKDTEELAQAVAYAASKNVIVTGASGNSGTADSMDDPYIYPASYDEVISVGSLDLRNNVRSNSQKNDKVFVTAPGENIAVLDLTLSSRCKLASGTSYASPLVAAMAVAAKQVNKNITVDEFKKLLEETSTDAGNAGYDNAYGYGIVNYDAFVEALGLKKYVLMNIPYSDFYGAVGVTDTDIDYDAITTATNKAGNYGKAGGAYHTGKTAEVAEDGTVTAVGGENGAQIKGVIWPVVLYDMDSLKALKGAEITDASGVTVATLGRGQTSYSELKGYEALMEAPAYSYCVLGSEPDNYMSLSFKGGTPVFSENTEAAVSENAIEPDVIYGSNWGDVQLDLSDAEGASDKLINAVVLTAEDSDGEQISVGFAHLANIWSSSDMAWRAAQISGLDGSTIKNIRYYCTVKDSDNTDTSVPEYLNYIYDYPVELAISEVYKGEAAAEFSADGKSIILDGLPENVKNLKAKVYYTTGGRNAEYTYLTPLAVDAADDDIDPVFVDVVDNRISIVSGSVTNKAGTTQTYGEPVDGTEYTVELSSDNYIINKIKCQYSESLFDITVSVTPSNGGTAKASLSSAAAGTEITVTASANEGYRFTGWTITCAEASDSKAESTSFIMPAANVTVEASFRRTESEAVKTVIDTVTSVDEKKLEEKLDELREKGIDEEEIQELKESVSNSSSVDLNDAAEKSGAAEKVIDEIEKAMEDDGELKEAFLKAQEELIDAGIIKAGEEAVLSLQPVLNIEIKNYESGKYELEISASYNVVASSEDAVSSGQVITDASDGKQNAVIIAEKAAVISTPVNLSIQLPSAMADSMRSGDIFVRHDKDNAGRRNKTYHYKADLKANMLSFTSKHGLSPFTIDTSLSADDLLFETYGSDGSGGSYFETLQDALDDVENNGTIKVLGSYTSEKAASVEMDGADKKTFKVDFTGIASSGDDDALSADNIGTYIKAESGYAASFERDGNGVVKVTITGKDSGSEGADTYTITDATSDNAHGGLRFSQYKDIEQGQDVTVYIEPDSGYELSKLTVNGDDKTADVVDGRYTIRNISEDITVKATFKSKSSSSGRRSSGGSSSAVNYTLRFDTGGGSAISSITGAANAVISLSSYRPTRDGYTFEGWYSDSSLTKAVTSVTLNGNTTVYAKWTANASENNNGNNSNSGNNGNNSNNNGNEAVNSFTDVDSSAWYYDAVRWAVEKAVTTGTSPTAFSPEDSCTRAQMVTFLWRAAGSPEPTSSENPFTDIDTGAYYAKAVLWAVENGITNGATAMTFDPDGTVNRGQTVTFIYRAAGSPHSDAELSFTDLDPDFYYMDAVNWAVANDITKGTGEDTFSPGSDCTRAQIVTLLYRYYTAL